MQTWRCFCISAKSLSVAALQNDDLKLTALAAITVGGSRKPWLYFDEMIKLPNKSMLESFFLFFSSVVKNSKTTSLGAKQWLSSRDRLLPRQVQASQVWATNSQEENISTCCVMQFSIMSYCGPNYILPLVYMNPLDFNAVCLLWAIVQKY